VPTPDTVTVMEVGVQPALSVYLTLKVMSVNGVPDPGAAWPWDSASWWEAPAQLAPRAGIAVTRIKASAANPSGMRRNSRSDGRTGRDRSSAGLGPR